MTPKEAISARYRPDLKPKQLYSAFHAAAADLARESQFEYAVGIGKVFDWLAGEANMKVSSPYLGAVLTRMHKDGTLAQKLKGPEAP
jgi:hypothetical protein